MKVIITGSEGFIGRALSIALQKRGVEVIGIDRKNGQEAAEFPVWEKTRFSVSGDKLTATDV